MTCHAVIRDEKKGSMSCTHVQRRAGKETGRWRRNEGGLKQECQVVRLAGIEPATLGFGGQYSIH